MRAQKGKTGFIYWGQIGQKFENGPKMAKTMLK